VATSETLASRAVTIEHLAPSDVEPGLALSDAAGWNQTADDWAFFIGHGRAFGIRDDARRLVATAAALPYGGGLGWISMVLVEASHRHRGHATRLLGACVDALRSSARVPLLDATPDGAAVYGRAGFVGGFAFERWQGETVPEAASAGDRAVAPDDANARESLLALDRSAWGIDRAALLCAFLDRPTTRAWLAPGASGCALLRAGRRAQQLGPVIAADEGAAMALVGQALAAASGRVFIDVPTRWPALAALLGERGFVRQRAFRRMALGDSPALSSSERVFALAGPEFG